MLQLTNIKKTYVTGDFTQVALDDVSISFRDSEFVAILGPSGSGKTTLLNIIGGLDHYDSGDLIVDGVSTKEYSDRDWDTYRNNRIGFVFQTYNLIPHQTVLANVELALTLSGIGAEERHERALEALRRVGLEEHQDKKPNQLSGGQMQRVAIARALINDPEIVLADEPTGALDSKTSTQIMDLLTEVAKDRLVIMVTHNPDLAETYATRTVHIYDGKVESDSQPFDAACAQPTKKRDLHKTTMSFKTALALSFNNLMTKKGRTIMTAFAGSIGIIGIAAILALANGVNNYIENVEEETLSQYPLTIQSTGVDLTSLLMGTTDEESTGMTGGFSAFAAEADDNTDQTAGETKDVTELKMVADIFDHIGSNDLKSLKAYFDDNGGDINSYTNAIQYSYDVVPQLYNPDTSHGVHQVNPDTTFSALGLGSQNTQNSVMSMSMSTDVFSEMMDDEELIQSQYDLKAGHWPENYDELILVLNPSGKINDYLLYTLGLRDYREMDEMVDALASEEQIDPPDDTRSYSYDELLNVSFKLVYQCDYYQKDSATGVWKDKSSNESYMKNLVKNGKDVKIAGIIQAKEETSTAALRPGIYYTSDLTKNIMDTAADSDIVQDQLDHPKTNVFTGKSFEEEKNGKSSALDMSSLFSIDGQKIQQAFKFDASALDLDGSGLIDEEELAKNLPDPPEVSGGGSISTTDFANFIQYVMATYPTSGYASVEEFLNNDPQAQAILSQFSGQGIQEALEEYITTYTEELTQAISSQVSSKMQSSLRHISDAFSIDADKLKDAFKVNIDSEDLSEVVMSLMSAQESSCDSNLQKLGYADPDSPSEIEIYPKDFACKEKVIQILDDYNNQVAQEDSSKEITYTDFVGTLMTSVTSIVNMISMVLIAFVAISLVVSSIMIGVITYISVLERIREIGILRSLGASKRDIAHVFNAETLIIGFAAGAIGILITALCCIPANAIVYANFQVPDIAILPVGAALILILISMGLTFLAGLIPSKKASKMDPVEALRTE